MTPDSPQTEAGKRRLAWAPSHFDHCAFRISHGDTGCTCGLLDDILAVEQEARDAFAARLREAVRNMPDATHQRVPDDGWKHVRRPAVLQAIEEASK